MNVHGPGLEQNMKYHAIVPPLWAKAVQFLTSLIVHYPHLQLASSQASF